MNDIAKDILKLARGVVAVKIPVGATGSDLYWFMDKLPTSKARELGVSFGLVAYMAREGAADRLGTVKNVIKILEKYAKIVRDRKRVSFGDEEIDAIMKAFYKEFDSQKFLIKQVKDAMRRFGGAMGGSGDVAVTNGGSIVTVEWGGLPKYRQDDDDGEYEEMMWDELDEAEKEFKLQFSKLTGYVKKHSFEHGDKGRIYLHVELKKVS